MSMRLLSCASIARVFLEETRPVVDGQAARNRVLHTVAARSARRADRVAVDSAVGQS